MSNWSIKQLLPLAIRDKLRVWKRPVLAIASHCVYRRAAQRVASGPFVGMKFDLPKPDLPKLLGTYECEIHSVVREIGGGNFKRIVNVGAGEGYYAVGLARLLPTAEIHAYEMAEAKHRLIARLADANGVSGRIQIRGACDLTALRKSVTGAGPILLVMDVEGAEQVLLDLEKAPELSGCWIIVELHDRYAPGVTAAIERRFSATHAMTRFATRSRGRSDFPLAGIELSFLSEAILCSLMSEQRPSAQEWFYLTPR